MGMFKGFQKTGGFETTVKPTNMFAGFCDTAFGEVGNVGGVPTTGLKAWFRPDINITLDGSGNVSQWQDTTGTYTLSQGTAGNRPAYVQGNAIYNGRPYLNFTSNTQQLAGGNILSIGTDPYLQAIIIFKLAASSSTDIPIYSDSTNSLGGRYGLYSLIGSNWVASFTDTVTHTAVSTFAPDTNLHMLAIDVDRNVGNLFLSVDTQWRAFSNTITAALTNYNTSNFVLNYSGADPFQGYIFDVFIYNQLLSQTDYLMLCQYMRSLYNF